MEFIITIIFTLNPSPKLNVNPTVVIPVGTPFACGTAWLPHVTTYNPECNQEATIRHELIHARQWTALGPAFPLAYTVTAGRAFEDYMDMMWIPPEGMENNCPLVSIQENRVEFLPCYRF